MSKVRGTISAVVTLALVATLASCGSDPADSSSVSNPAAPGRSAQPAVYADNGQQVTLVALDNNFLPEETTIVAGTKVVFTNNGRNPHNVVPEGDPTAKTWGVLEADFQPKDSYSRVFDTPGTYVYYCTIHGTAKAGMVGSIVVTAP